MSDALLDGVHDDSAQTRFVNEYAQLARRIRDQGLLRRRYGYYWVRLVGTVLAFALVWVGVVLLGNSWFQLVLAALLAVVAAQLGFLGHDAAHRQIFASRGWNDWTARVLTCLFGGLGHGWWMRKHSRHHAAPNQERRDPDIGPGVVAFTPAVAASRGPLATRIARYQGWFFFPLLLLEGVSLHVAGIVSLVRGDGIRHRAVEAAFIAVRLVGFFAAVLILLPPGKAAAFIGVQMGLFGLLLGGAFAPNHTGMPIVPAGMKTDFLRRQVLMSRNIRGGRLTDVAMGGLNHQIEHHLFPSMPRPNLRLAQPYVRAYCAERDISYNETSLLQSYGIIVRYLSAVGLRARDPFECPLVRQYRG